MIHSVADTAICAVWPAHSPFRTHWDEWDVLIHPPTDWSGVLLVDDDALVRAGLRMILSSAEDIRVVAEIGDGAEAVDAVRRHRPDLVLMDIRMPKVDGIAATTLLRPRPTRLR